MASASEKQKSLKLFGASLLNCKQLGMFVGGSVRPILDRRLDPLPYRRICHTLLLRVQAWLTSVSKLDSPGDFQAANAAARAIYETAIDMVLVHHEEKQSVKKLVAWEQSCKLKYAERLVQHSDEPHVREFIAANKERIVALRAENWGHDRNGRPIAPERWTGRKLDRDATIAEKFRPLGFVKFHGESYAPTCWYVHGSAVVGLLEISDDYFPILSGLALYQVAQFGQVCAEYALRLFDAYDSISEERLKQLQRELRAAASLIWAK